MLDCQFANCQLKSTNKAFKINLITFKNSLKGIVDYEEVR